MGSRKKHIFRYNPVEYISFLLIVTVLLITLGYSSITDNLMISNSRAAVRLVKDIRVTGFRNYSMSNEATSDYPEYSYNSVHSTISLPNSNSSVTYEVEVTNIGNVEQGIMDILGLPSNLKYTLNGYTLEATLCDSVNNLKCSNGSVTTFLITIEYGENGYDGINTEYNLGLTFDFDEINYTARIGNNYYTSLQAAANAVPTDHTETTIVLLKNTTERVTITAGKNIILDFQGLVLTNSGDTPVVEIKGTGNNANIHGTTVKMNNGVLIANTQQGAINVEKEGVFIMTGGRIVNTSTRQALYVDNGGTAIISGSSFLSASAEVETAANGKKRGTVQTVAGGTLTILGGTIEANGTLGLAVSNAGTTTIGTKDGNISTTSPSIKGVDYGVYMATNGTLNYYDGIIKGKVASFNDENLISDKETDSGIVRGSETIGNDTYKTATLAVGEEVTITFNADGGTVSEASRKVLKGTALGILPVPTRTNYTFLGWFTAAGTQGTEVTATDLATEDMPLYAHWENGAYVAKIGTTRYVTLQEAVNAVPNNTETTITMIGNTTEQVTIGSAKRIILDADGYTISNDGVKSVFEILGGTLTMISGTITTNTTQGAINVKSNGTFNISGGSILSTGTKQAIYIDRGTANISGTAYLRAKATVDNTKRGTVHVLANNTLNVTGGTIEAYGSNGIAISNYGTTTIGIDDAVIDANDPLIISSATGILNSSTASFNDGIVKARTTCLSGNSLNTPNGSSIVNSNEMISNVSYYTMYLQ